MIFLNKFLTVILFLNCLFLVLLVLVQLPKKEAGLGTSFGGGATDALFGSGAGNVLTKLTKWCAVLFLSLCLLLSLDFMNPKQRTEGQGGGGTSKTKAGTTTNTDGATSTSTQSTQTNSTLSKTTNNTSSTTNTSTPKGKEGASTNQSAPTKPKPKGENK